MLRHAAGDRRRAFGHIEPRRLRRSRFSAAARRRAGVVAHVAQAARHRRSTGNPHPAKRSRPRGRTGRSCSMACRTRPSIRRARSAARTAHTGATSPADTPPGIPGSARPASARSRSPSGCGSPAPFFKPATSRAPGKRREEVSPSADVPVLQHGLRAVRIVERQDARLHESIGRAEARRMLGIAFDLGRPAQVTLDQQAGRDARRRSSPSHRTAACREPLPPAGARRGRSPPSAAWCRPRRRPARATRPSASGTGGATPDRSNPACGWETRLRRRRGTRRSRPPLPGFASNAVRSVSLKRCRSSSS